MSPLAPKHLLDLEEYKHDLESIAAIPSMESYFRSVTLLGGEPLLHPHLSDIIRLPHEHLPKTPLVLVSNGILVERAGDDFWDALADCNAKLLLSAYPIGIDYDQLLDLASSHGVAAALNADATNQDNENDNKTFFRLALETSDTCDSTRSFNLCPFGGTCLQLRGHALWFCSVAAWSSPLKEHFGCHLTPADDDRLPLADITSTDQIEQFRRKAHSFCRYCDNEHMTVSPWTRSQRLPNEWLVNYDGKPTNDAQPS